jgi:Rrf2 family protein
VLQSLAAAGLVETKEGRDGGYTLGRSADRITLGDVYLAVKTEVPEICENVDCGEVGELLDLQLDKILLEAEQHTIEYLRQFTIEDVAGRVEFFADSCPNAVLDK